MAWWMPTQTSRSPALEMNKAWFAAALIDARLIAWLKLIAYDGDLAGAEPKTLRHQIFHAAARLVRRARHRRLKIAAAWHRLTALPQAP